jgi:hypothetical protein
VLLATQNRATEDLLAARAAELRAFDERLRARDDELNRAHLQIREYKVCSFRGLCLLLPHI